jgi:type IV pilus assembly protein PilN
VKTIPSSARLSALKQNGQSMSLDGVAQSNASVAEYMRNIEASPWMGHADLRKTENTHNESRMPYAFGLNVSLSRPETDASTSGAPAAAASSLPPAKAMPPALGNAAKTMTTPASKPVAASKPAAAVQANGGAKP